MAITIAMIAGVRFTRAAKGVATTTKEKIVSISTTLTNTGVRAVLIDTRSNVTSVVNTIKMTLSILGTQTRPTANRVQKTKA